MLDVSVEESREKRLERQRSRFRDRGGIFVPSNKNTLIDILLARSITGESPVKKPASRDKAKRKSHAAKGERPPRSRSATVQSDSDARDKSQPPPLAAKSKAGPKAPPAAKPRGRPPKSKSNLPPTDENPDKPVPPPSTTKSKAQPAQPKKRLRVADSGDELPDTPTQKRQKTTATLLLTTDELPPNAGRKQSTATKKNGGARGTRKTTKAKKTGDATTKPRARGTQPSKRKLATSKSVNDSDDDSDLNLSYPPPRSSGPVKAKRKIICDGSGDEDDNGEGEEDRRVDRKAVLPPLKKSGEKTKEKVVMGQELITRPSAAIQLQKRTVKRRPRIVPINIPSDIEEEDEEDEEDVPKISPSKKRSRGQDEEDGMQKKRHKNDPRKKVDDSNEPSMPAPKKRARKVDPVARGDNVGAGLEKATDALSRNLKENALPLSKPKSVTETKKAGPKKKPPTKPPSRKGPPRSVLERIRNASPVVVDSDSDPLDFLS